MIERSIKRSTAAGQSSATQVTVLLVADDERVRQDLHLFLQCRGYEVIGAASVEKAGTCKKERGRESLAVIVSGRNLHSFSKGLQGNGFYQRWTVGYPDLPFRMISGDPTGRGLPPVRAQAVRFLAKPFTLYHLLSAVRSAVRRHCDRYGHGQA